MPVIDSLLRKKRLLLARQQRTLHDATKKRDHAAQVFILSRRAHEEAQHDLLRLLSPDEELCVQRLATAKGKEQRCELRMQEAQTAYRACVDEHGTAEKAVTRTQHDIDKLEEMRLARLAEKARERQVMDWQRLDEWVTVRQGKGL